MASEELAALLLKPLVEPLEHRCHVGHTEVLHDAA
jgi:hypothetical protein